MKPKTKIKKLCIYMKIKIILTKILLMDIHQQIKTKKMNQAIIKQLK